MAERCLGKSCWLTAGGEPGPAVWLGRALGPGRVSAVHELCLLLACLSPKPLPISALGEPEGSS